MASEFLCLSHNMVESYGAYSHHDSKVLEASSVVQEVMREGSINFGGTWLGF